MGINQDSLLTERETGSEEENNKGHTLGGDGEKEDFVC